MGCVSELVVKLHERCQLKCDHCYMYEAADQHWRARPVSMAAATVERLAARLAEHVRAHQLATVEVVLHGGEPLLVGRSGFADALCAFRSAVGDDARVLFAVQTN